mmetsp:Transcript_35455/g.64961  ORF Transcript_35455/g.64961 Transcript_35455/m.64961 type:complete len:234 (-) Transcript_35455:1794-2495(-)
MLDQNLLPTFAHFTSVASAQERPSTRVGSERLNWSKFRSTPRGASPLIAWIGVIEMRPRRLAGGGKDGTATFSGTAIVRCAETAVGIGRDSGSTLAAGTGTASATAPFRAATGKSRVGVVMDSTLTAGLINGRTAPTGAAGAPGSAAAVLACGASSGDRTSTTGSAFVERVRSGGAVMETLGRAERALPFVSFRAPVLGNALSRPNSTPPYTPRERSLFAAVLISPSRTWTCE